MFGSTCGGSPRRTKRASTTGSGRSAEHRSATGYGSDFPSRLADVLAELAGVDPTLRGDALPRAKRRALVSTLTALVLPVTGDRGWPYAEVTAGGISLTEVRLETMESRVCPGLYLCGEILDVDGRIGGFNFQWAWASGTSAGRGAAR